MKELATAASKARDWTERRDALIREARAAGQPLRTIAQTASLSHTAVAKICARSS